MSPTTIPGNLILQSPTANDPLLDLNTQPSLDLQFATSKTLDDRVSGQNLITFSRSTTGTYVDSNGIIQTAAIDAPRFDHDPTTGESLGLLIEESRTNLLTYSEDIASRLQWISSPSGSETADATTAPDGLVTADYIYGSNPAGGFAAKAKNVTANASSPITFTVYAKKADTDWISLRTYGFDASANSYAWFDISNGVKGSTAGVTPDNYSITPLSNGWYRCSLTVTLGADAVGGVQIRVVGTDGATDYGAGETVGAYLWGAQLEVGAFPTSYIPTSGSTVTRAADVASITGTNFSSWYNQSEGSFVAKVSSSSPESETFLSTLRNDGVEIADGFKIFSSQLYNRAVYYPSGTSNDFINYSPLEGANKLAIAGSGSESSAYFNGIAGTVFAGRTPQGFTPDGIKFGSTQPPNGIISRLTYYPYRLPDATLQEITS